METPGQKWDNGSAWGDKSTTNMQSNVFPLERIKVRVKEVGPFSSQGFMFGFISQKDTDKWYLAW